MGEEISLSELLSQFRKSMEMKQTELSEQTDVPAPSLSFYENGERTPPYKTLVKLLEFFDARLVIEADQDRWIFEPEQEDGILLEKQPRSKERGLLSGLDEQEKKDLVAYIRRRRRSTENNK